MNDDLTIAYMSGYHNAKSKYIDEIERLRKALQTISDGAPFDMYGEDQYYWCQDVAWDALNEEKK
jgi:hypothetical protein